MVKVKMDLRDMSCEDVNWIELAKNRVLWWALMTTVFTSLQVP
jgi:hypothetical protein